MRTLLIDIGNSRIKWRGDDAALAAMSIADAIANEDAGELPRHWEAVIHDVEVAFVSNVAGAAIEAAVTRTLQARWPAIRIERVVPARMRHGIVNDYADPARLGPDRWLAMIGARALFPDRSLLVCSFGTATTIDLLTRTAGSSDAATDAMTFVGGMILPGADAMGRALARDTARLPARRGPAADIVFANDTEDAIGAGIAAAQAGAVERAYREARHASSDHDVRCLVTGGGAPAITPLLRIPHDTVLDLVLLGLGIVARSVDADIAVDASTAA